MGLDYSLSIKWFDLTLKSKNCMEKHKQPKTNEEANNFNFHVTKIIKKMINFNTLDSSD